MTIASLLEAYRSQQLTPAKLIDSILSRIAAYESHHIWIQLLTREQLEFYLARLQGHSPDTLPLFGIPFAIKDNIDLAGIPTTAACPAFAYTPTQSAFAVQQLIDAGAIPLGKANLDQFATGLVGTRSPYGICKNSFDPDYIAGGSSSGSAVAVAVGLVSFALGTDTAGSGRVPAAFNNLVGVKPSRGLISTQGVVPACRSLDCVTVFALTSDDANRVLNSMIAYDSMDCYARPNPFNNNSRHYGKQIGNFVFGVPHQEQLDFFGDRSAEKLFNDSVQQLQAMGGQLQEINFAPFLQAARLLYEGPWIAERFIATESLITTHPEKMLPVINTIIQPATDITATDTFRSFYRLQECKQHVDEILSRIDFLVTPTTGTIFTIAQVNADPIRLNSQLGYYTNYMNLLDLAAVAAPAGFLDNGLPWGVTFVGPVMSDRRLLSFANRWQQQLGLPLGATQQILPPTQATNIDFNSTIPIVVAGAHLDGLPLNWQLRERGAQFVSKTVTAKAYRLYALSGGPPYRPGLIRDSAHGHSIEVEVWDVPRSELGSFVAGIPAPLGIGKVELADGRWLTGFICEGYAIADAVDITEFGGWRSYIKQKK